MGDLERGWRRGVVCRICGATGNVYIGEKRRQGYRIEDKIPHKDTCDHAPPREQPRHLKNRLSVRRQETHANSLVGARETPASGALNNDQDGRRFHAWRTESKQTRTGQYLLTQKYWTRVVSGSLLAGEEPMFHVRFLRTGGDFVIVRAEWWNAYEAVPPTDTTNMGRINYYVRPVAKTPCLIPLDPPGVLVHESAFKKVYKRAESEVHT